MDKIYKQAKTNVSLEKGKAYLRLGKGFWKGDTMTT